MARDPSKPLPPPQAFTGNDYHKLLVAVEKLAHTQLGMICEPFTIEELARLFVPPQYLSALQTTFKLEDDSKARGEIYVSLRHMVPSLQPVFPDADVDCNPNFANLRVYFHRDWAGDKGFVTPEPVFGTPSVPITRLEGPCYIPETLADSAIAERFVDMCQTLMRVAGEWAMVAWVLGRLQKSVRTPQQMRYVWPAIHTIASTAELDMDLSEPSSRAGINATPEAIVLPYLKPTYDVVARSVLLGVRPEYINRYRTGQLRLVASQFRGTAGKSNINVDGI